MKTTTAEKKIMWKDSSRCKAFHTANKEKKRILRELREINAGRGLI